MFEGGDKRKYAGINLHYAKTGQQVEKLLSDWDERKKKAMAGIVICERCESFGREDAAASLTLNRGPRKNDEDHQLCPACVTDFDDFWAIGKDRKLTPRDGQAFTEPWKPAESEKDEENNRLVRMVAREFAKASAEYRDTPTVDQLVSRIRALEAGKGDSQVQTPTPEEAEAKHQHWLNSYDKPETD